MDKIKQLQQRKQNYAQQSKQTRADIASLVDEDSFVELSAFSFSKSDFYGEDACGEGVVCGFATVNGYPHYIVAQNFAVCSGGLSKANCDKIARMLNAAEKNETPVIYLLHTQGVQVGEGVNVLEGIAQLLLKATQLKGTVLQYAVVCGEVYGSAAALASVCDCVFFTPKSALCINSPLVLSAKAGKNLKAEEVGGYDALKNAVLPSVFVKDIEEIKVQISAINDLVGVPIVDAELNAVCSSLNENTNCEAIVSILENGVELGANCCPEVKTVLGRVGGISVAAVVFDQKVTLNERNVKKIKNFAELACCFAIPFVTFVDCVGVEATLSVNNSAVMKEISEYLSILDAIDTAKVAVVSGSAVGLGYSLFAAKSVGFDYVYAFANAKIALFDTVQGAEIEFSAEKDIDKTKLIRRYADEASDPVNAAKGGYVDDIIEPQFVKQYLIACLQMLVK